MSAEILLLCLLFFIVAAVYSSAGLGGGSSYLAILTLFNLDYLSLRPTALLCNITVVGFSTLLFYKHDLIPFKKILPLIFLSIPMAFVGGRYQLEERTYFILLGFTLLIAGSILIYRTMVNEESAQRHVPNSVNTALGGGIGFISGLVGIGGGIFLAPILHLLKWDRSKVIAATAAFFILVNSLAGFIGYLSTQGTSIQWSNILPLLLAVFIGGQIGSRLTVFYFDAKKIRLLTALLIIYVAGRILYTHF